MSLETSEVHVSGAVHPVAELFPMMSEEELDELAADIVANGLIHPVVVDHEGVLLDGRNRLVACQRAGVLPICAVYEGDDPVAFILSANVLRRNMNKGQAAMAVARAGRFSGNHSTRAIARETGVSQSRLVYAYVVLDHAPELADAVMSGAQSLNEAYAKARDRKGAAEALPERLARLREAAPGLADLVAEERLTLNEAEASLREREELERSQRAVTTRLLATGVSIFDPQRFTPAERAADILSRLNPGPLPDGTELTEQRLDGCAAVLAELRIQFAKKRSH